MIKSFKITIYLFILILSILIFSCCTKEINIIKYNQIYKGGLYCVYDDIFYSYDSLNVFKWNLNDTDNSTIPNLPLCSDPLCTHNNSDCPLYSTKPINILVVDDYETKQNNNSPIFYISTCNAIKKYDTSTNRITIIKDNIEGSISQLWICGDRLYYKIQNNEGYKLCYLSKDGKENNNLLREDEQINFNIIGFYNGNIYYFDDTFKYYYTNLNLSTENFLMEVDCYSQGNIIDNYLYYGDNTQELLYENIMRFQYCDLYKYNLDNGISEKIDDNILMSYVPMVFKAGNMIVYNKCIPVKTGTVEIYDADNNLIESPVFDSGSKKFYYYNSETGEQGVLFDDMGYNLTVFIYADDSKFLCIAQSYSFDEDGNYIEDSGYKLYNYKEGKMYSLEPIPNIWNLG